MKQTTPHQTHAAANDVGLKVDSQSAGPGSPGPRSMSTPMRAIGRGLVAGALGTAAMDALLYERYRRDGGESSVEDWELSAGLTSWDQAPAPAQVGKRLVEGLFNIELPAKSVPVVNNVTHWAFGIVNGAQYGIVAGSLQQPKIRHGLLFGATVWAAGYVVLPAAKLYKPIWEYDAKTLAKDLSAHLVYGLATASALRALSR
ncbi:MAG TPA: DUF1440 domain-containing protein [Solirubrobacteraceae bacterium]